REPIDAQTTLVTGAAVKGPVELRNALLARSDQFVQAVTQKLMMYALGRKLAYHHMTQVRAIVRDAAKSDYARAPLSHGNVRRDAFRGPAWRASPAAWTVALAEPR